MKNLKTISLLILFLLLSFSSAKAQITPRPTPSIEQRRATEIARRQQQEDFDIKNGTLQTLINNTGFGGAPVPPTLSKAERSRIRAILTPNEADTAKYKDFLKQKNTGLIRLFPDYGCQAKNVIRVDGKCGDVVPDSWNYSFRQEAYTTAAFLDLNLKDGNLTSEGFLSQGIIVRLGDVPLETVLPTSGGLKFLFDFVPQRESAEAKKQYSQIAKGVAADGYTYSKTVKAEENTTYALRVVAYRGRDAALNRYASPNLTSDEYKLGALNYFDKRVDMTVAFRIVRREQSGDVTILWKRLNRQDAPKIDYAKGERPSDIKSKK